MIRPSLTRPLAILWPTFPRYSAVKANYLHLPAYCPIVIGSSEKTTLMASDDDDDVLAVRLSSSNHDGAEYYYYSDSGFYLYP